MTFTINWVEPSSSDVGSVLIYRADSYKLDQLGSRTIITTTAAKDGTGSWVTSYTDASGDEDNIYRIQFWDGVGSTPISDPLGQQYSETLATYEDVVRLARLSNHSELGSAEVYDAINDATDEVWFQYGDPIKKTAVNIDSETGVTGQAYDFTGDQGPVYQLREVIIVDGNDTTIVDSNDYEVNFGDGTIKFTDAFLGSYSGDYVYFHWVPTIYNMYVKYQAAVNLLEGELILTGIDATNPQVQRLKDKIGNIEEYMRPKGVFSSRSFEGNVGGPTGYEFIPQAIKREHLYFTN